MQAAFALIAVFALAACSDLCGNTVHQVAQSPDRRSTAVLFERDCGATTGLSTQVSVVGFGEEVTGGGNVFVADGGERAAPWGGTWAEVEWRGPGRLIVRYDATARVFERNGSVGGVQVSYEAVKR